MSLLMKPSERLILLKTVCLSSLLVWWVYIYINVHFDNSEFLHCIFKILSRAIVRDFLKPLWQLTWLFWKEKSETWRYWTEYSSIPFMVCKCIYLFRQLRVNWGENCRTRIKNYKDWDVPLHLICLLPQRVLLLTQSPQGLWRVGFRHR